MIVNNLINSAPVLKTVIVDVPELGEDAKVMLREFNAKQASEFNRSLKDGDLDDSTTSALLFHAKLICACAVDEKGNLIASLNDAEKLLNAWQIDLIFRVGGEAANLNGFSGDKKGDIKKPSESNQQQQQSEESLPKRKGRSLK